MIEFHCFSGEFTVGRMGGREEDKPPYIYTDRHFGVAVATWGSYNAPMYGAMVVVSGHGLPTGAVQRCHSLGRDIIGLAKFQQKDRLVNIGQ